MLQRTASIDSASRSGFGGPRRAHAVRRNVGEQVALEGLVLEDIRAAETAHQLDCILGAVALVDQHQSGQESRAVEAEATVDEDGLARSSQLVQKARRNV